MLSVSFKKSAASIKLEVRSNSSIVFYFVSGPLKWDNCKLTIVLTNSPSDRHHHRIAVQTSYGPPLHCWQAPYMYALWVVHHYLVLISKLINFHFLKISFSRFQLQVRSHDSIFRKTWRPTWLRLPTNVRKGEQTLIESQSQIQRAAASFWKERYRWGALLL